MPKKIKAEHWDFVIHEGRGTIADCVTAKCSVCGEPLFCNPHKFMGTREDGTVVFSGFFIGMPKEIKESIITDGAEARRTELPKFCSCCGTEMKNDDIDIPF